MDNLPSINCRQMQSLQTLQKDFVRNLSTSAAGLLQAEIKIALASLSRTSYWQFLAGIAEPSCCFLFSTCETLPAGWLEISPPLARSMAGSMLSNSRPNSVGPLERTVLSKLTDLAMRSLTEAWPGADRLAFKQLTEKPARRNLGEGEPQSENKTHPDETFLVLSFAINFKDAAGSMRLCLPDALLRLIPQSAEADSTGSSQMRGGFSPVELLAVVNGMTLTADELSQLSKNDVLVSDTPAGGEVILKVAGIPKFAAKLGTYEGKITVSITRKLT